MTFFETGLPELSFRQGVLLFPLATGVHVLEEWPGFPRWARRFASPDYSDRAYVITHALAIVVALASAAVLWEFPRPPLAGAFFAAVFGPAVFWNALFHAAATIRSRTYCPGAVTGVAVYLPLTFLLARLALRARLLSPPSLAAALVCALGVHVLEVGHNVFKRW